MYLLRRFILWLVVLLLPLQAVAASAMMQCQDMAAASQVQATQQDGPAHDHAAMMAAMGSDMDMSDMNHAAMDHAGPEHEASDGAGCDCGCQCAASCSVGCASVAAFVSPASVFVSLDDRRKQPRETREQAHAAYRYDPLRPPSAVAL